MSLGELENKSVENYSGAEQSIFRVIFQIRFDIITTMIVQNTVLRVSLFQIESFDSWMCPLESQKNKYVACSREQGRAYSELSFKLGSTLSIQWFCKIPFSWPTYFELKVLLAWCVPLDTLKVFGKFRGWDKFLH